MLRFLVFAERVDRSGTAVDLYRLPDLTRRSHASVALTADAFLASPVRAHQACWTRERTCGPAVWLCFTDYLGFLPDALAMCFTILSR